MASITFGGLASGLDTNAIIDALMDIERQPLERLERDKSFYKSRLEAFSTFDSKLDALKAAFEDIDTSSEFRSYSAKSASEEFFSVETSSLASAGSYAVEVVNLAQVQKDVSAGYASPSDPSFSAGSLSINGTNIAIDGGDALSTIVDKINAANAGDTPTGVSAALINDGTASGYRIVLSGEDASSTFSATATGVSANGTALTFTGTQTAQQATAIVDGITIVSNNNTLSGAIPGVTVNLLKENEAGEATSLSVSVDTEGVKAKLDQFVTAYNEIITFIADQKDTSWQNDSGLQSVKRRMQKMLVQNVGGTGSLQHLVDIGVSTDENDGTISLDATKINDLIANDFESLEQLFLGDGENGGIVESFSSYLDSVTSSVDGLYASKKKSTDSSIKGIDRNIQNMELRLEQRERSMRTQFEALELLMSSMNSTSSYLTQQISNMNNNNNGA